MTGHSDEALEQTARMLWDAYLQALGGPPAGGDPEWAWRGQPRHTVHIWYAMAARVLDETAALRGQVAAALEEARHLRGMIGLGDPAGGTHDDVEAVVPLGWETAR